jgi:hypothetical protein
VGRVGASEACLARDVVDPKSLSEYGVDVPVSRPESKYRTELVLFNS